MAWSFAGSIRAISGFRLILRYVVSWPPQFTLRFSIKVHPIIPHQHPHPAPRFDLGEILTFPHDARESSSLTTGAGKRDSATMWRQRHLQFHETKARHDEGFPATAWALANVPLVMVTLSFLNRQNTILDHWWNDPGPRFPAGAAFAVLAAVPYSSSIL